MSAFDGVGNFFNQLGTDVHGLLGGAMQPPKPAQTQNKPLSTPPATVPSSLQGMAPPGGAPMSGPKPFTGPLSFLHGTGVGTAGENLLNWDFGTKGIANAVGGLGAGTPQGTVANRLSNASDQWAAGRAISSQNITTDLGGGDAAKRMARLATNPFGYAADVLNAGIVSPAQLSGSLEMWMAEDQGPSNNAGNFNAITWQNSPLNKGSVGHNYLRDVFNPVLKAITGSEAPHTSLYYSNQAKDLTAQANKLDQLKQQIDANPNATQQDRDAWDGAHTALTQKFQQYQTESAQSADWYANSPTSKVLRGLGKLPEIGVLLGASIAAPEVMGYVFGPGIAQDPMASTQSFAAQVTQGVDFAQTLANQDKRDHMTSAELAANIENITFLATMAYGPGRDMAKGVTGKLRGTSPEDLALQKSQDHLTSGSADAQARVVSDLQTKVPDAIHSPDSPVEHVAEVKKMADQMGPATQDHAPRIAELEQHIQDIAYERQKLGITAEDLHQRRALSEEMFAARDEINNLKGQPKAMERIANQAQTEANATPMVTGGRVPEAGRLNNMTIPQLEAEYRQKAGSMTDEQRQAIVQEINRRGVSAREVPAEGAVEMEEAAQNAAGQRKVDNLNIALDIGREKQTEQLPRFTKPVIPENPYPDMSQATNLGKNYPDLKPDGNVFSLNAGEAPTMGLNFEDNEAAMFRELVDMGYDNVKTNQIMGNGWFTPKGRGIALPDSFNTSAHKNFLGDIQPTSDERTASQVEADMIRAGYTKVTDMAGVKAYSVDALDPQNVKMIQENMKTDMKKGIRQYPYVLRTNARTYRIRPTEMIANNYDLADAIRNQGISERFVNPPAAGESIQQGGQIGTETTQIGSDRQAGQTSQAGQTGEGYHPTEAGETPTGIPEGSTLTSIVGKEGEGPVAVWEASPKPAAAVQQLTHSEQLRAQLWKSWDQILPRDQLEKLWQARGKIDLAQRQASILNTWETRTKQMDPMGIVKHINFDTKLSTDALFDPVSGIVSINPYKIFPKTFVNSNVAYLKQQVALYRGSMSDKSMQSALDWVDSMNKMTQEDWDHRMLSEELFHAYDTDHFSLDGYLAALDRLPESWWQVQKRVLGGKTEGGVMFFDATKKQFIKLVDLNHNPITSWIEGFELAMQNKLDDTNKHLVAGTFAELRANQGMRDAGVPGVNLTYRVTEAFNNELRSTALAKAGAKATGETFPAYVQAETAANLTAKAAFDEAQVGPQEGLGGGANAPSQIGATADTGAGLLGRDAGDQTSLAAGSRPIGTDVEVEQLVKLGRTGYEGNWRDFAMAVVRPDLPSFENVAEYFNKLSPEDQATWLKVGGVELAREEQYGVPMEAAAAPENIDSPMFQARMARIRSARQEVAASGKILDDMARTGRPQTEIDAKKAHVAAIRKYSELPATMKEEDAKNTAKAAGQAELEALSKGGARRVAEPVFPTDLQERGIVTGKRTAGIPEQFATFIAGRLTVHGYRDPMNIEKFVANLWAGDKTAMKEYKQLTGMARDAIEQYTGFAGEPDLAKATGPVPRGGGRVQIKAPQVGGEIAGPGGTYVNPVDSAGLKTTVQNADVVHVRHGETGHNADGKIRSTLDVPLNRTGIAQANRVAWAFRGQKIGMIITSPLERAYKTAAAIAKVTGAKVVVDENMRPWDLGDKKGTSISAFIPAMKDYIHNNPDVPVEGGESFNQFKNRYLTAYQSHLAKYANKGQIVFVDHARTVRLAEDYHNAGGDASKMDYKALDAPVEVGPGGVLALQRQGNQHAVTGKVSQAAGTIDESLAQATEKKTPVKPVVEAATSTPLEQAAQKSRVVIRRVAKAQAATQAVKGDIAPRLDIEARIDTVAVDPTHPAVYDAIRAKTAQDQVTTGKAVGVPAAKLKEFQADYAQKLEVFAQKLATQEEATTKFAEASKAPVKDRGVWNKSFRIAQELRQKVDAGRDRNIIAQEAAKAMGMTLGEARAALKDHQGSWSDKAASWAPAYKDLLQGPAAELVRGEKLKAVSSKTLLPGITKEEMMGVDAPLSKQDFQTSQELSSEQQAYRQQQLEAGAPISPVRPRPQTIEEIMKQNAEEKTAKESGLPIERPAQTPEIPKPKRKPIAPTAIGNILKASTPKREIPKEESGQQARVRIKHQVEAEGKSTKSTAELRDEVAQVHEQINTPSPNMFVEPIPRPSRVVIKKGGKGGPPDEPAPDEEMPPPVEEDGTSGGGKKPPGNVLDGLNESRDEGRAHPNLEGMANRMHTFLTEFAKRTDPGTNQSHPVEQAKAITANEMADLHRADFIQKEIERLIPGNDLERNRLFHPAIENKDELTRQAYMKESNFSPEDTALANLLHTHWEVMGRIATQADRQLFEIAQEHYLTHMLKFNEFGKDTKDNSGTSKGNSPMLKAWMERKLDEETGTPLYQNIASLVEKFGPEKVEERISVLYGAHATSMAHLARTKELIDEHSGTFVDPNTKIASISAFEESQIKGGIGGRGLKKGAARYSGRTIVPVSELKNVPAAFRDQLVPVTVGPMKVALKNFLIYAPEAEHFERLAKPAEGASLLDKAADIAGRSNDMYKFAKFAYNPIHWFNVVSDIEAMMGRAGLTARPNIEGLSFRHPVTGAFQQLGLYSKIWGRVNGHLQGDATWKPAGVIGDDGRPLEFAGEEAISQVIKAGGTSPRKAVESSGIGLGFARLHMENLPGMAQFAQKMWTDTVWKGHIGLALHLTDVMIKSYTKEMGHAPNEAVFKNMMQFAALNAKYAVGYIDKADMTRDFDLLSNGAVFASKWTTTQARMSGRALPQGLPIAKWLANVGGGERYTKVLTDQMREQGGMTQEDLDFVNGQTGHLARQMMVGGSIKLLGISALMGIIGSQIFTGSVSTPIQNFQRDPTHTFDIYTGNDPVTGKDTWQHNPLFGMQQEMLLYILAGVRAHNDGQDLASTLMAGPARMLNKANPISVTLLNEMTGQELGLSALGYGDAASLDKDKSIIAIRHALDAQHVPDLGGLEDRIIYAIRQVVPSPGFPESVGKNTQIGTKGDIANALGPGKWLGAGDLWAALESGNGQNLVPTWGGSIAQFMTGSRQATSLTPQKVQENNQIGVSIANRDAKDAAITQMHDAFAKGDFKTVGDIANQQGFDNSQLISALFFPPAGTGGGVQYQGTTYGPSSATPAVTLAGTTQELTPAQQSQFEGLKMANTKALLETISQTNDWKVGTGTARAAMFSAYRTLTEREVSDQYAQKLGLLGGAEITNAQIGNVLETAIQFHDLVGSTLANNPVYQQADPTTRQKMETTFSSFGISLAHEAVFGNLVGVPIGNVAEIITNTIQVEESTKSYLQGSMFYQLAAPGDQARMVNEYTTLARTIVKAGALGQGQGPNRNEILPTTKDMLKLIDYTMNVEESAKSVLHGSNFYVTADPVTQKGLDTKYETLARSLAFAKGPTGDPAVIVKQSLDAEQAYYALQNQFGGTDYLKLMAQQLTDAQMNIRQSAAYTPRQITAIEKAVRAQFLEMNPSYASWLKAKAHWTKNTSIGQIYLATNASEYQAVQDMTTAAQQAVADQVLYSGTSIDPTTPTSDPSQPMGLTAQTLSTFTG